MKASRRQFIQTAATGAAAATVTTKAADPFAPAEASLIAQWFNKGNQHVLPVWAFDGYAPTTGFPQPPPRILVVSPSPRPVTTDTWARLSGGVSHNGTAPYASLGDNAPVGRVFHGTAVEWNGALPGGNLRYNPATKKWGPAGNPSAGSAWACMRDRVAPDPVTNPAQAPWGVADTGNWGKFGVQDADGAGSLIHCYHVEMKEAQARLRPDAAAPALAYTYGGMLPGPTFRFRHGMPAVVRFRNLLQTEVSIHHHGGHNPTHGDGFPSYYVIQGEARDYLYPNILPLRLAADGRTEIDFGEGQSTTWYHDHGLDATAYNVSHGLSGFAMWYDEVELQLIRDGVLPGLGVISRKENGKRIIENPSVSGFDPELDGEKAKLADAWKKWKAKSPDSYWSKRHTLAEQGKPDPDERTDVDFTRFYREAVTPYFNPYDIPIALQDRVINLTTGQIVYDSDGHNGYIGNTQLINGRPWPAKKVSRRKYRLRLLDGSNARIYRLRFLASDAFRLQPGPGPRELTPVPIKEEELESKAMEFLRIGKDSWLWPMPQKRKSLILNMANRADIIVDFGAWYDAAKRAGRLTPEGNADYYLVNTMPQFDGRGPKGKLAEDAGDPNVFPLPFTLNPANTVVGNMRDAGVVPGGFFAGGPAGQMTELNQPIGLIKFIITPDMGEGEDATIDETTILRPRHAIPDEEVMAVREFVFERGKGAWMINSRFYDPTISSASAVIGMKGQNFIVPSGAPGGAVEKASLTYAEEWILRNGGGGWWHPIHIHLEGHQLAGYEKDFEADGFVGADGLLGVRGQAAMARLPDWEQLVGKFGLDKLQVPPGPELLRIKKALLKPEISNFTPAYVAANPLLPMLINVRDAGTALLTPLRAGPTITQALAALPADLRTKAVGVLDALDELRLQWAGEVVGNHDTQALGPNTIARIRMRFRTWQGPVVFHCHNVEHEDMRMMVNFEAVMSKRIDEVNKHDPNINPAARTHGQDVTDLLTNPAAVGEMPWESVDGHPSYAWEEKPVPGTPVEHADEPLIKPRPMIR